METIQVEVRHRLDRDCGESEHGDFRELLALSIERILDHVSTLNRKVDQIMTDLSALQAAVDQLYVVEGAAAEELVALKDEIATLTAGAVSQEQIDSLTDKATQVATALTAATEAAKADPTPPAEPPAEEPPAEPPAEEPPVEGGQPPAEPPAEGGEAPPVS